MPELYGYVEETREDLDDFTYSNRMYVEDLAEDATDYSIDLCECICFDFSL